MSFKVGPSVIQNIKFFDDKNSCISHFEAIHWYKKALSLINSFGTCLIYALNRISHAISPFDNKIHSLTKMKTETDKRRLVVCIHALNESPYQFTKIVDEMQKKDLSQTNIFVPRVLQNGNASLDEMVKPIFEEIAKWAKTSGEKELVLVGISNGARISRAIEAQIAKSELNIKKLQFVSIVGACKGSSLVNLANKLGLSWLMSKCISSEMPTDSIRNQQLNKDWQDGLSLNLERDYTFIASPHDWLVTNYDSSLMDVSCKKARYAIIPNHGHNSIVNAVAKSVAEIIFG